MSLGKVLKSMHTEEFNTYKRWGSEEMDESDRECFSFSLFDYFFVTAGAPANRQISLHLVT